MHIKNNMKAELNHDRYRVVHFRDIESKTEFRLATNLWHLTDEEVSELYRRRWVIMICAARAESAVFDSALEL